MTPRYGKPRSRGWWPGGDAIDSIQVHNTATLEDGEMVLVTLGGEWLASSVIDITRTWLRELEILRRPEGSVLPCWKVQRNERELSGRGSAG